MPEEQLEYPAARTVDVREEFPGAGFPDPYRWLEDESEQARAWQRAQNALTDRIIEGWPYPDASRASVDHCVADGSGSPNWMVDPVPWFAGGRRFRLDRVPEPDYPDRAVVVVSDGSGDCFNLEQSPEWPHRILSPWTRRGPGTGGDF